MDGNKDTENKMRILAPVVLLSATIGLLLGCDTFFGEAKSWESRLYSPTLLTKLEDTYFIVDAWHNRILYSRTLDAELQAWKVLDSELAGPHSIASNDFISGPGKIHRVRYDDDSYEIVDSFAVPSPYRQMNDIIKVEGAYYLTNTHDWVTDEDIPENTIHRCEALDDFASRGCEDVKQELGLEGIPYYISEIDGRYYIAMANQYNGIAIADVGDDGRLIPAGRLFDVGPPTEDSLVERFRLPK